MNINEKWKRHFVIDVESDGPHPVDYNMIKFGIVNVYDPSLSFLGEVAPLHMNEGGIKQARDVCGVSFEDQMKFDHPAFVMQKASGWIETITESNRAIFWSDNPAFDWQFWNAYVHKFTGDNPAGFSARRIGDFDAGRRGEVFNTNAFKKRRKTAHTHDPVDDARGNVEALRWVLEQV